MTSSMRSNLAVSLRLGLEKSKRGCCCKEATSWLDAVLRGVDSKSGCLVVNCCRCCGNDWNAIKAVVVATDSSKKAARSSSGGEKVVHRTMAEVKSRGPS